MIENSVAVSMGEVATDFCPTLNSCGYFARGAFALENLCVFKWFESPTDLSDHLLEIEMLMFQLDRRQLKALYQVVWPMLHDLTHETLTSELREEINRQFQDMLILEWWGSFEDLAFGSSAFAGKVRKHFRFQKLELSDAPLHVNEQNQFIEYIRSYGLSRSPGWQPWIRTERI
ncbi:hypothetical protein [Acinetobacter sp. CAAS 2-6]|uniref:hypothetical protein n=1 Tax=Acinetobacter sp. CAAS 2-6 TaxID=3016358 RepID=UPI002DD6AD5A|nr:hypothetical protein [Acinetobacter sp. CAAS 2-6]